VIPDEEPILYIANFHGSKPVISLYDGRKKYDKNIQLAFGEWKYQITITSKNSTNETMKIVEGKTEQTLFDGYSSFANRNTRLLWVGDLNGDGKIDLILERFGKEGLYSRIDLWLSTKDDNTILKLISSFIYGGCT
jgi:hypothetical protein